MVRVGDVAMRPDQASLPDGDLIRRHDDRVPVDVGAPAHSELRSPRRPGAHERYPVVEGDALLESDIAPLPRNRYLPQPHVAGDLDPEQAKPHVASARGP